MVTLAGVVSIPAGLQPLFRHNQGVPGHGDYLWFQSLPGFSRSFDPEDAEFIFNEISSFNPCRASAALSTGRRRCPEFNHGIVSIPAGLQPLFRRNRARLIIRYDLVSIPAGLQPLFRRKTRPCYSKEMTLQLHSEREELSLESSWEISRQLQPLRAFLASMCHARSCNPSDWYPSSKARTA